MTYQFRPIWVEWQVGVGRVQQGDVGQLDFDLIRGLSGVSVIQLSREAQDERRVRTETDPVALAFCLRALTTPSTSRTDSRGYAMSLSDSSGLRETSCTEAEESRRVKKCSFSEARLWFYQ